MFGRGGSSFLFRVSPWLLSQSFEQTWDSSIWSTVSHLRRSRLRHFGLGCSSQGWWGRRSIRWERIDQLRQSYCVSPLRSTPSSLLHSLRTELMGSPLCFVQRLMESISWDCYLLCVWTMLVSVTSSVIWRLISLFVPPRDDAAPESEAYRTFEIIFRNSTELPTFVQPRFELTALCLLEWTVLAFRVSQGSTNNFPKGKQNDGGVDSCCLMPFHTRKTCAIDRNKQTEKYIKIQTYYVMHWQ